jgi:glycosyltransferase involved in cell wall biosynthesis
MAEKLTTANSVHSTHPALKGSIPQGGTSASHDHIIDQIDRTLELIAEAQSTANGDAPIDHYAISIIVPVFNELNTLPKVLDRIRQVMPTETEIIVVDDCSTDGTTEWLQQLPARDNLKVIHRRRNHGKGSAVRLAIKHSRGDVVAIQDADSEYDPADLLRVIWPILDGDAEVVFGSRYLEEGGDQSLVHRLGNGVLTSGSNLLTGLQLTDMETCHKAFDGEMLRSIPLQECRFGFEPEITAKVARRTSLILEVPVGYDSRGYDEGKKIGWRDGFAAFACIWKYRKG